MNQKELLSRLIDHHVTTTGGENEGRWGWRCACGTGEELGWGAKEEALLAGLTHVATELAPPEPPADALPDPKTMKVLCSACEKPLDQIHMRGVPFGPILLGAFFCGRCGVVLSVAPIGPNPKALPNMQPNPMAPGAGGAEIVGASAGDLPSLAALNEFLKKNRGGNA